LEECTASHIEDTFLEISEEYFLNSALRVLCIMSRAYGIVKGINSSKLERLELQGNQNTLVEQFSCGATIMISCSTNSHNFVRER
jgi:hypothetical protein